MVFRGKVVSIVYFYKNGKLVWDYVLPNEVERTRCGFRVRG